MGEPDLVKAIKPISSSYTHSGVNMLELATRCKKCKSGS